MKTKCDTCKFKLLSFDFQPCASCTTMIGEYGTDNWQPAEPARPKRKELEAQLTAANAEIESMHRELADKQAIIDEQEKGADDDHEIIMQISALNGNLRKQRQEARRWAIKFRDEVLKLREWGKKDKAIIALLEKERDEARRELGVAKRTNTYTYILPAEARRFARYWYAAALEARAECTALAEIMIAAHCPFCGKSHLIDLSSGVEDEYICRDVRFGDFA